MSSWCHGCNSAWNRPPHASACIVCTEKWGGITRYGPMAGDRSLLVQAAGEGGICSRVLGSVSATVCWCARVSRRHLEYRVDGWAGDGVVGQSGAEDFASYRIRAEPLG